MGGNVKIRGNCIYFIIVFCYNDFSCVYSHGAVSSIVSWLLTAMASEVGVIWRCVWGVGVTAGRCFPLRSWFCSSFQRNDHWGCWGFIHRWFGCEGRRFNRRSNKRTKRGLFLGFEVMLELLNSGGSFDGSFKGSGSSESGMLSNF